MTGIKTLVSQTAIYGLSSILGRLLNFLLVPLYTAVFQPHEYGVVSILMSVIAFAMIVFTYGIETAFFHFSSKTEKPKQVYSTGLMSLTLSSVAFSLLIYFNNDSIAEALHISSNPEYISWLLTIVVLDTITTLPFAKLRLENRALRFAAIRITNIGVNIGLNLFFILLCPYLLSLESPPSFIEKWYDPELGIGYIFIANLCASAVMFLMLIPEVLKIKPIFDVDIWKKMMKYSLPLLVGGLAFVTNELADRLLLEYLLPNDIATAQVGIYSACYKIAIFMTLFVQAFRYGAEPFFFSQAKNENAKQQYALVMHYFVAFTAFIFLAVNVFIDFIKHFIRDEAFHEGLKVVPILLLANLFLGVYYNLSVWYKVTENTRFGAYLSTFGAVITIAFNLLLIPIISYVGSAWATLICYFSMCTASYIISRKYYLIPYNFKRISTYLVASLLLFQSWTIWHDSYFVMSLIYCFIYILIVLTLERKKISTFKL